MFYKNLIHQLYNYKFSIVLLIFLILVALQPLGFAFSKPIAIGAISVFLMFSSLVFNRFYMVAVVLFTILISFDAYFAYAFASHINIGFIASIIETDASEACSMLSQAWKPALIIFGALLTLFYLSAREMRQGEIRFKYFFIAYLVSVVLIGAIYKVGYDREDLRRFDDEYPVLIYNNLAYTYTPMLYGDLFSIYAYYDDQKRFKHFKSSFHKPLPQGVEWKDGNQAPQKIFMVIGESAYRGNHSIYGYSEATTPFLDSLKQADASSLYVYQGIAGANITRNALRLMMSSATAKQLDLFYTEKTLIEMAKKAGYKTTWISNQGNTSLDETYIGYLAWSADVTLFLTKTYFESNDLDMLPIVDRETRKNEKQLIVIHLVGSHQNYCDRYDAVDYENIKTKDKVMEEYDCSIHHTDRFMRGLYKIAEKNKDYLIYYTSDHGDEPGKGHGFKGNRYQFDVPLLAINKSGLNVDSIFSQYIQPTSSLLSNVNTLYFMGEVMGYAVSDSVREQQMKNSMYILYSDQSVGHYDDVSAVGE